MLQLRSPSCVSLAVLISILFCVAPASAALTLSLSSSDPHGLVTGPETTVSVQVAGEAPGDGPYVLKTVVEDFDGAVVEGQIRPLELPAAAEISQAVKFDRYGGWMFKASVYVAGSDEPLAQSQLRLVRPVPPAKLTPEQIEASPIGINVHLRAPWKLLGNVGVHWARDYIWGMLRDGRSLPYGIESWSAEINYKELAEEARDNDVMILACMQGGFRTADGKYFTDDVAAITAAYKKLAEAISDVKYWELDNEAELQHRGNPEAMSKWMDSYLKYIRAASKGLAAADGNQVLVLNGDAGIQYDRTEELLNSPLANDFGITNCHYYTGSVPPEISLRDFNTAAANPLAAAGFLDQLRKFAALTHAHGKQAWFTEVGWDETNGPAVGTRNQTLFLPRMYLLSEFCEIDKTFWFFDRDTNGAGIFSTMGLVDNDQNVRFFAATLAAVSKFIATADYAGSIDLGEDRWCLAFRTTDGRWLVAAWTVQADHELPDELASAAEAYDVFGNAAQPAQLTPAVSYFYMDSLPAGWEAQLPVRWLSDRNMTGFPGRTLTLEAALSDGVTVAWSDLPEGLSVEADPEKSGQFLLQCSAGMPLGEYAFAAKAVGEGWSKTWPLTIRVIPPLQIRSLPYVPGEPTEIEVISNAPKAELAMDVPPQAGELSTCAITVSDSAPGQVTFTAAEATSGPVRMDICLSDGAMQHHWLRPRQMAVPQVTDITLDGDLGDWPADTRIDVAAMEASSLDFEPTGWVGWSEEGVYLAARIPFREAITGRPEEFWNFPAFELLIDSDAAPHDNWPVTSHQFWFMPMSRDGKLTVNVGEWKRNDTLKANNLNVREAVTAVRVEDSVAYVEVFLPAKLLGAAPKAGATWRAVLSYHDAKREEYHLEAVWPQAKAGSFGAKSGLLEGTTNWGLLRLAAP